MEYLTIPNLPSDVIDEILTWLPVKTLLKFRCVCKSWRTLISSQQFVRAHLKNSNRNFHHHRIIGGFEGNFYQCSLNSRLYESGSEQFDLPCPIPIGSKRVRVVGSCNGLVCIYIFKVYFILWNPSSRNWKILPNPGDKNWAPLDFGFEYGFGFDESSGDYKVVGFFYRKSQNLTEVMVQVYSLRNNEWKRIKSFVEADWRTFGPATFANGKLYWVVVAKDRVEGGYVYDIVSLDLENEEAGRLQMPCGVNKGSTHAQLGVSDGSLHLLCSHSTRADVWIMHGCNVGNERNWTKLVTIIFTGDFRELSGMKAVYAKNGTKAVYVQNGMKAVYMQNGMKGVYLANGMKAVYVENGRILVFCAMRNGFIVVDAKDCSITYPHIRTDLQASEFCNMAIYFETLVSPLG